MYDLNLFVQRSTSCKRYSLRTDTNANIPSLCIWEPSIRSNRAHAERVKPGIKLRIPTPPEIR